MSTSFFHCENFQKRKDWLVVLYRHQIYIFQWQYLSDYTKKLHVFALLKQNNRKEFCKDWVYIHINFWIFINSYHSSLLINLYHSFLLIYEYHSSVFKNWYQSFVFKFSCICKYLYLSYIFLSKYPVKVELQQRRLKATKITLKLNHIPDNLPCTI